LRLRKALQLCNQDCQASEIVSSFQPGISLKLTGVRLADEALSSVVTGSTTFGTRGTEEGGEDTGFVGGVAHEIRNRLATTQQTVDLRTTIVLKNEKVVMLAKLFDEYPMLLFVLEGLLALVILLAIVFWTGKGRKE